MADGKAPKSRHIFLLIRIIVVLSGLAFGGIWLSAEQRWRELIKIFNQVDFSLFVFVFVMFLLTQVAISFRWWLLLKAQSVVIDFKTAVRLNFLGWFYNNFMPGSVGGDIIRAWYVTRHTDKKVEAALSVFVDRVLIGLLATFMIAVFCYLLFLRNDINLSAFGDISVLRGGLFGNKYVIAGLLLIAALLTGLFLTGKGRLFLKKGWLSFYAFCSRLFLKLKQSAVLYLAKPFVIVFTLFLTVIIQIITITCFWLIGRKMGVNCSIVYYYFIFTLTWVLGAIPISIGGAVVIESMLACLFARLCGIPMESGLALALSQRLIWMLASLPGVVIHLSGTHLPKDFFVDYNGTVA